MKYFEGHNKNKNNNELNLKIKFFLSDLDFDLNGQSSILGGELFRILKPLNKFAKAIE